MTRAEEPTPLDASPAVITLTMICTLQEALSAATIALEISSRNARVAALQQRWDRRRACLDLILDQQGAGMADVPGGASELLVRDDRGKEADRLVNRVGTAGENYPVKVPAGEPEGWSLDSPALIAAVPPYHQVAVLKYRRHATPDLLAARGTCPGRTKDGGCSVEFTRPPSSHIGEIVALTAVPLPGDQPSSQVEV
jgi:hypothetical protein